jgi:Ca2+-binding EF-hand superfamily protein
MQQDMTRQQAQQMADEMFQRFDTNHDGTLTRDEAQQAVAQFGGHGGHMVDRLFGDAQSVTLQQAEAQAVAHFDAMDLNHDGIVSAAERQQARAAMRAQEKPGQ